MCISLQVKCPIFFSDFNKTVTFSTNIQIPHFMKIHLAGAELLRRWTDGLTDITKVIAAFRNFTKASKSYHASARVYLLPGEGKAVHLLTLSLKRPKSGCTLLLHAPRLPKGHSFLQSSQVSSVCPSGNSNVYMKMSMKHIPPMRHTHHYGVYVTHL